MSISKYLVAFFVVGLASPTSPEIRDTIVTRDPYEIVKAHYVSTGYLQGDSEFWSVALWGTTVMAPSLDTVTFCQLACIPSRYWRSFYGKQPVVHSGNNGRCEWKLAGGQLSIIDDEKTKKKRLLDSLLSEYDQLDPESDNFQLSFEGFDTVQGQVCFVVRMTNSITDETVVTYYDTTQYYGVKIVSEAPDLVSVLVHDDFRRIDGFVWPFHAVWLSLSDSVGLDTRYDSISINIPMEDSLFDPPGGWHDHTECRE